MSQEGEVLKSISALWKYCCERDFYGHDPHDALNSPYFTLNGKFSRQAATELLKRSPVNLRNILSIEKGQNPKGLGLFLSSAAVLYRMTGDDDFRSLAYRIAERLSELKSEGYSGHCWGYNFDWQSQAFFLPKYIPTVVVSTFVGNAFIDAYEIFRETEFLKTALSVAEFIANDIYRTPFEDTICFSYSPEDKSLIHSVNMLGAAYLSRVALYSDSHEHAELAYRAVEFTMSFQRPDGSWFYGVSPSQKWVDNFHTGCIIDTFGEYIIHSSRHELENNLIRAAEYYAAHLFQPEGIPKKYPDDKYPIDIHSCSQSIITLSRLAGRYEKYSILLDRCIKWTLTNMKDPGGYFYYQRNRLYTNRISYMRWSQAWMLRALTIYYDYMQTVGVARPAEQLHDGYRIVFEENGFSFEKVT